MTSNTRFWLGYSVSGEEFEVQSTSPDNYLLYRTAKSNGKYYAGSYSSIAEIEDRFRVTLEEDS